VTRLSPSAPRKETMKVTFTTSHYSHESHESHENALTT
jgi:hypothetical protein